MSRYANPQYTIVIQTHHKQIQKTGCCTVLGGSSNLVTVSNPGDRTSRFDSFVQFFWGVTPITSDFSWDACSSKKDCRSNSWETQVHWLVVSTPLKNMKVSWDDSSKYGKLTIVPNHQPDNGYHFVFLISRMKRSPLLPLQNALIRRRPKIRRERSKV